VKGLSAFSLCQIYKILSGDFFETSKLMSKYLVPKSLFIALFPLLCCNNDQQGFSKKNYLKLSPSILQNNYFC